MLKMCCTCMCLSVTVFMFILGDDDGHFLMDKETGEMKLIRGFKDRPTTPALNLQVMVRLTYSVLAVGLKDISLTALFLSLFVLQPGISEWWPQEIFCCYSVSPSPRSEPLSPGVRHGWISRLCDCRKESCLSGQYIWQQSPGVTCSRSGF